MPKPVCIIIGIECYHAQLGRFGSRDPIYNGANLYRYCGNNPLTCVDPRGLMLEEVRKAQEVLESLCDCECLNVYTGAVQG